MSPSIAVVLNAVFDRSGQLSVPNRSDKPVAKKHENFYCILAGNTWGSGSVEYQGREVQDSAFLDRFKLCRIEVDYDKELERKISGANYEKFMAIRKFIAKNLTSEVFSTRSIVDAVVLMKSGETMSDIIQRTGQHWDPELLTKMQKELL